MAICQISQARCLTHASSHRPLVLLPPASIRRRDKDTRELQSWSWSAKFLNGDTFLKAPMQPEQVLSKDKQPEDSHCARGDPPDRIHFSRQASDHLAQGDDNRHLETAKKMADLAIFDPNSASVRWALPQENIKQAELLDYTGSWYVKVYGGAALLLDFQIAIVPACAPSEDLQLPTEPYVWPTSSLNWLESANLNLLTAQKWISKLSTDQRQACPEASTLGQPSSTLMMSENLSLEELLPSSAFTLAPEAPSDTHTARAGLKTERESIYASEIAIIQKIGHFYFHLGTVEIKNAVSCSRILKIDSLTPPEPPQEDRDGLAVTLRSKTGLMHPSETSNLTSLSSRLSFAYQKGQTDWLRHQIDLCLSQADLSVECQTVTSESKSGNSSSESDQSLVKTKDAKISEVSGLATYQVSEQDYIRSDLCKVVVHGAISAPDSGKTEMQDPIDSPKRASRGASPMIQQAASSQIDQIRLSEPIGSQNQEKPLLEETQARNGDISEDSKSKAGRRLFAFQWETPCGQEIHPNTFFAQMDNDQEKPIPKLAIIDAGTDYTDSHYNDFTHRYVLVTKQPSGVNIRFTYAYNNQFLCDESNFGLKPVTWCYVSDRNNKLLKVNKGQPRDKIGEYELHHFIFDRIEDMSFEASCHWKFNINDPCTSAGLTDLQVGLYTELETINFSEVTNFQYPLYYLTAKTNDSRGAFSGREIDFLTDTAFCGTTEFSLQSSNNCSSNDCSLQSDGALRFESQGQSIDEDLAYTETISINFKISTNGIAGGGFLNDGTTHSSTFTMQNPYNSVWEWSTSPTIDQLPDTYALMDIAGVLTVPSLERKIWQTEQLLSSEIQHKFVIVNKSVYEAYDCAGYTNFVPTQERECLTRVCIGVGVVIGTKTVKCTFQTNGYSITMEVPAGMPNTGTEENQVLSHYLISKRSGRILAHKKWLFDIKNPCTLDTMVVAECRFQQVGTLSSFDPAPQGQIQLESLQVKFTDSTYWNVDTMHNILADPETCGALENFSRFNEHLKNIYPPSTNHLSVAADGALTVLTDPVPGSVIEVKLAIRVSFSYTTSQSLTLHKFYDVGQSLSVTWPDTQPSPSVFFLMADNDQNIVLPAVLSNLPLTGFVHKMILHSRSQVWIDNLCEEGNNPDPNCYREDINCATYDKVSEAECSLSDDRRQVTFSVKAGLDNWAWLEVPQKALSHYIFDSIGTTLLAYKVWSLTAADPCMIDGPLIKASTFGLRSNYPLTVVGQTDISAYDGRAMRFDSVNYPAFSNTSFNEGYVAKCGQIQLEDWTQSEITTEKYADLHKNPNKDFIEFQYIKDPELGVPLTVSWTVTLKFERATANFFDGQTFTVSVILGAYDFKWNDGGYVDSDNMYDNMKQDATSGLSALQLVKPTYLQINNLNLRHKFNVYSLNDWADRCGYVGEKQPECLVQDAQMNNYAEVSWSDPSQPTLRVKQGIHPDFYSSDQRQFVVAHWILAESDDTVLGHKRIFFEIKNSCKPSNGKIQVTVQVYQVDQDVFTTFEVRESYAKQITAKFTDSDLFDTQQEFDLQDSNSSKCEPLGYQYVAKNLNTMGLADSHGIFWIDDDPSSGVPLHIYLQFRVSIVGENLLSDQIELDQYLFQSDFIVGGFDLKWSAAPTSPNNEIYVLSDKDDATFEMPYITKPSLTSEPDLSNPNVYKHEVGIPGDTESQADMNCLSSEMSKIELVACYSKELPQKSPTTETINGVDYYRPVIETKNTFGRWRLKNSPQYMVHAVILRETHALVGYNLFQIVIKDPCTIDKMAVEMTKYTTLTGQFLTPQTVAGPFLTATMRFTDSNLYDTQIFYDLMNNDKDASPCGDFSIEEISVEPVDKSIGSIFPLEIRNIPDTANGAEAKIITIEFRVSFQRATATYWNSVTDTFEVQIMLGECARTLTRNPANQYETERITVLKEFSPQFSFPNLIWNLDEGGSCGGSFSYVLEHEPSTFVLQSDIDTRTVYFSQSTSLVEDLSLTWKRTWRIALEDPIIHTVTLNFKVDTYWLPEYITMSLEPHPFLKPVAQLHETQQIKYCRDEFTVKYLLKKDAYKFSKLPITDSNNAVLNTPVLVQDEQIIDPDLIFGIPHQKCYTISKTWSRERASTTKLVNRLAKNSQNESITAQLRLGGTFDECSNEIAYEQGSFGDSTESIQLKQIINLDDVGYLVQTEKIRVDIQPIETFCLYDRLIEVFSATARLEDQTGSLSQEQLAQQGISLVSQINDEGVYESYLEIYNEDKASIGTVFDIQIRARTSYEPEKDVWYQTTKVKIVYQAPPCPASQDQVSGSQLAKQVISMAAEKGQTATEAINDIYAQIETLFQATSALNLCGPLVTKLVNPLQHSFIELQESQQMLRLRPIEQTAAQTYDQIYLSSSYEYRPDQIRLDIKILLIVTEPPPEPEKPDADGREGNSEADDEIDNSKVTTIDDKDQQEAEDQQVVQETTSDEASSTADAEDSEVVVESIAESKVQLEKVLTTIGLPSLREWIAKQKQLIALEEKRKSGEIEVEKPQAFVKKISSTGQLTISFTKKMNFPENLQDYMSTTRKLQEDQKLIDVFMISTLGEIIDENLKLWELVKITDEQIDIQIQFEHPILVSQDIDADKLLVILSLSDYPDKEGQSLPKITYLEQDIPRQAESEQVIENLQAVGKTAKAAATGSIGTSIFITFLMSASLSQIWSLVNAQQTQVYTPLFTELLFPQNASTVNIFLISIASFDLIPTDQLDEKIFKWPDDSQPFNANFEQCELETTYLVANGSFFLWFQYLNLGLIFVVPVFFYLSRAGPRCLKFYKAIRNYVFFNGLMRLWIQSFFESILLAFLNFHMADWKTTNKDVKYSNNLSLVILASSLILFFFLPIMYRCKMEKWSNPEFTSRYGAFLDGTNLEYKGEYRWIILGQPILFLLRRVIFVLSVILLGHYLVLQLFIQLSVRFFIFFYLVVGKPMDSPFALRMELFNEVTGILSLYTLFLFTNFVPDPSARSELGYVYIAILIFNFSVHILFLLITMCLNCKRYAKRKQCASKCLRLCGRKEQLRIKPRANAAQRNQAAFVTVVDDQTGEESKVAAQPMRNYDHLNEEPMIDVSGAARIRDNFGIFVPRANNIPTSFTSQGMTLPEMSTLTPYKGALAQKMQKRREEQNPLNDLVESCQAEPSTMMDNDMGEQICEEPRTPAKVDADQSKVMRAEPLASIPEGQEVSDQQSPNEMAFPFRQQDAAVPQDGYAGVMNLAQEVFGAGFNSIFNERPAESDYDDQEEILRDKLGKNFQRRKDLSKHGEKR